MNTADSCDVLIVGGGPAGSSCARMLARAGLDVVVMDKSQFPRDKVCAGWVTTQVVDELEIDLEDYGSSRTLQPITGFITGLGREAIQRVDYDRIVSYGIRRCEFDDYLLRRSGARLRLGESFKTMTHANGRWLVNDAVSASLVIGAGGHFCPVVRFLGADLGKDERAIYAQEIEFDLPPEELDRYSVDGTRPELYFSEDLGGYGWCFRKGNFLNVGLGREGNHALAEQVRDFAAWLAAEGKIPADLPGRFKGHAYILYPQGTRPLTAEGVMIIGDAVGLAYAQSGEGIRPAVESGLLAAQVAIEARGKYRR
jgi:geranylgeranyl reductase family protein